MVQGFLRNGMRLEKLQEVVQSFTLRAGSSRFV